MAEVAAFDDRGKQFADYAMSSYIDTDDWNTVYIAKSESASFKVKLKGDIQFLHEVVLLDIKPKYFNMREHPEDIDINQLVAFQSTIPEISARKNSTSSAKF